MEQGSPQADFVQSDSDNKEKGCGVWDVEYGVHRKPRRHPRFSSRLPLPVQESQLRSLQQLWNNSGDLSGFQTDTRTSMKSVTAAMSDGCDVVDQSGAVESFFASIRIPASFMAATSFMELFGVELNHDDTDIQRHLNIFCLMCQGASFLLSMNVIVMTSSALTRAMTGGFDPYAETGYEFLFREFHYEFVCVRWSFLMSLILFLFAVTAKILYEFELFNIHGEHFVMGHLELGIGVCLIMAGLMMHLASYIRSTLVGWRNATEMTYDLLKMLLKRGYSLGYHSELVAMFVAFIGVIFVILALVSGT